MEKKEYDSITDSMIEEFQSNYSEQTNKKSETKKTGKKKLKRAKKKDWFELDEKKNNYVYVSNLPLNFTMTEFEEVMSKCGILARDKNNVSKSKLYKDEQGNNKGDGLCCYVRHESVELAINILNESVVKDKKISVTLAEFRQKGEFDPKLQRKMRKKVVNNKDFDWVEDDPEKLFYYEKTILLRNVIAYEEVKKSPQLMIDYKNEIRRFFDKMRRVKNVRIYPKSEVVMVTFRNRADSNYCLDSCNNRTIEFLKNESKNVQISFWDGKTKFEAGSDEEGEREANWERFLNEG